MHTKSSLLASLDRLWSVEPVLVQKLRAAIERVSEEDVQKIARVVEDAIKKQDAVLTKLVKADPALPGKLRQFLHERVQSTQKEVAKGEETQLGSIIEQLESS